MDQYTKSLIRSRAEKMFVYCKDHLMFRDESDYDIAATFRFCVLALYSPREFLRQFQHGSLLIDSEAVNDVYWTHRAQLPGPGGLTPEEQLMIRDHNAEAEALAQMQTVLPLKIVNGLAAGP